MRTLNLGILAHIDAGKTTLTQRLLYAAGVIGRVGSVDDGSTHTDSLPLEQNRGIRIKSAVVSFVIDDVMVNLIDTPGSDRRCSFTSAPLRLDQKPMLTLSQPETESAASTLQTSEVPKTLVPPSITSGVKVAGGSPAR